MVSNSTHFYLKGYIIALINTLTHQENCCKSSNFNEISILSIHCLYQRTK